MSRAAGPLALTLLSVMLCGAAHAQAASETLPAGEAVASSETQVSLPMVLGERRSLQLDPGVRWSVEQAGEWLQVREVADGAELQLIARGAGETVLLLQSPDGASVRYLVRIGSGAPEPAQIAPEPAKATSEPTPTAETPGRRLDPDELMHEQYKGIGVDLNLEAGGGGHFGAATKGLFFGRVRAGMMLTGWPSWFMLGATYELNNLVPATFGVQAEWVHLPLGMWAQGGGMLDINGKFGGMLSFGYSIIGVEGQYRGYADAGYGVSVLGKLRLPLGALFAIMSKEKAARNKRQNAAPVLVPSSGAQRSAPPAAAPSAAASVGVWAAPVGGWRALHTPQTLSLR